MRDAPRGLLLLALLFGFADALSVGLQESRKPELKPKLKSKQEAKGASSALNCTALNRTLSIRRFSACMPPHFGETRLPRDYEVKPILITGVGGSGTHTVTTLFQQNGVLIGHEKVGQLGTVSWALAVDNSRDERNSCWWLSPAKTVFSHVYHVTRCPIDVIASQTAWAPKCSKSSLEPNFQYMARHMGITRSPTKFDSRRNRLRFQMEAYNRWTDFIDSYVPAEKRFRVDQLKELYVAVCADLTGHGVVCKSSPALPDEAPKEYSSDGHRKHRDLTWKELDTVDRNLANALRKKAIAYGFDSSCTEDN